MKTAHNRQRVAITTKAVAIIAALAVVAIAVGAWFVNGNYTSYPPCTSLEYERLQSLWSVSMPSGTKVVSGPNRSCTTRGLGKLTSVGYVVNAGSYANYLALRNALRTSLAKHYLSAVQTSKDQLEMAHENGHTAFYMVPLKSATSATDGGFLATVLIQDGPI